MPVRTAGLDDVFTVWFGTAAPSSYAEAARAARPDLSLALHEALRRRGALMMLSPFGRAFLSFAHLPSAMEDLAAAFAAAAADLAQLPGPG